MKNLGQFVFHLVRDALKARTNEIKGGIGILGQAVFHHDACRLGSFGDINAKDLVQGQGFGRQRSERVATTAFKRSEGAVDCRYRLFNLVIPFSPARPENSGDHLPVLFCLVGILSEPRCQPSA